MSSLDLHIRKKLHGVAGPFELEVKLQVVEGELLAIYGPSGVGKTTLLRIIAGLERPDSGYIKVQGKVVWYDRQGRVNLSARKRKVGLVFQDYVLFPHLTVQGNIAFGQDRRKREPALVEALLEMMGLHALADRLPQHLSGGQAQRVALARAVAGRPAILLLDEALSALDPEMRRNMQAAVAAVHREFSLTTLLVSHDLAEVFLLADRVACLDNGALREMGTPEQVFGQSETNDNLKLIGKVIKVGMSENPGMIQALVQGKILELAFSGELDTLHQGQTIWVEFNPNTKELIASSLKNN